MQPTLFPTGGMFPGDSMRVLRDVANQCASNARMDSGGASEIDYGTFGTRMLAARSTLVRCFEITGCWERVNPRPGIGPSQGRFWVADACPVVYYLAPENHTFWKREGPTDTRIFYGLTGPDREDTWQRSLHPRHGVGQWVWCVFDDQADVWCVIDAFDNLIRFRLNESMVGCSSAAATAIGYPCGPCDSDSGDSISDSGDSSSSVPSSSTGCQGGFISSSSSLDSGDCGCLREALDRGSLIVYDEQGIVNLAFPGTCIAPACTTGWAKRCADSRRWEVVSYGKCGCSDAPWTEQSTSGDCWLDGLQVLCGCESSSSGTGESSSSPDSGDSSSWSSSSSAPCVSPALLCLDKVPGYDPTKYQHLSQKCECLEWVTVGECDACGDIIPHTHVPDATGTYVVTCDDWVIVANQSGALTVELPPATNTGRRLTIKNMGAGTCTALADQTDTIDGESTQAVEQYECLVVHDIDTGKWGIM